MSEPTIAERSSLVSDKIIAELDEAMVALLALLDAETRLVRASKLKEAERLQPEKTRLAQRYIEAIAVLKANGDALARIMPERLDRLRRRHENFREKLKLNMAVLATAKSVSEGLVGRAAADFARSERATNHGRPGALRRPGNHLVRPVALNRSP